MGNTAKAHSIYLIFSVSIDEIHCNLNPNFTIPNSKQTNEELSNLADQVVHNTVIKMQFVKQLMC